jgi:pimeloyl-ACP methyl ester carboxylesterase
MATTAPIQHPPVEACLAQLLDHFGIAGAHFAGRSLADVQGFIAKYPDRVASLTLVCPTVLNPRSLAPLRARLMVVTGDHGLGARRVQAVLPALTTGHEQQSGDSRGINDALEFCQPFLRSILSSEAGGAFDLGDHRI